MKNIFYAITICACLVTVITIASCEKQCNACVNGGTCDTQTGTCNCPSGYSGSECGSPADEQIAGTWSGIVNCGNGPSTASLTIDALNPPFGIIFVSSTDELTGTVSGNYITIPYQTFSDGTSWSGSGVLDGNSLAITINVTGIQGTTGTVTCVYSLTL
jgi:hypothetical protein